MRILSIICFLLSLLSCTGKAQKEGKYQPLSEEQKRKFFVDSFAFTEPKDTAINFKTFMDKNYPDLKAKNKYDPFIYALEETYVDTTNIDTTKLWFRLTVTPVFRKPYCLIVEKQGEKCFLTTKITNGDGGYITGTLMAHMKFQFPDTLINNLVRDLETINFFYLPLRDTTCGPGLDGETWTFEFIKGGKHHLVVRWLPEACGDNKTLQLARIGLRIREISRLDKILTALGEEESGM